MVKIKVGNLLDATENIICHQCNVFGHMSGGVAKQLANKYKGLEDSYSEYCTKHENKYINLSGNVFYYDTGDKIIANIFSQKENFDTDYLNLKIALIGIKLDARQLNKSIAMPYRIGCGIANGEWDKVYKIIKSVFSNYDVILYRLED